jgi:hypothetical protein
MIQLFPMILLVLFLAVVLGFLLTFGWFVYGVVKGLPTRASLGPFGAMIALYAAMLFAGSMVSRERHVPLGTVLCFDDWCVRVADIKGSVSTTDRVVTADVRVSSDAKRVTQSGSNPQIFFIDNHGTWYATRTDPALPTMSRSIAPGESFLTRVNAHVPAHATIVAVRVWEGGWLDDLVPFDEESPFHRKTFYVV